VVRSRGAAAPRGRWWRLRTTHSLKLPCLVVGIGIPWAGGGSEARLLPNATTTRVGGRRVRRTGRAPRLLASPAAYSGLRAITTGNGFHFIAAVRRRDRLIRPHRPPAARIGSITVRATAGLPRCWSWDAVFGRSRVPLVSSSRTRWDFFGLRPYSTPETVGGCAPVALLLGGPTLRLRANDLHRWFRPTLACFCSCFRACGCWRAGTRAHRPAVAVLWAADSACSGCLAHAFQAPLRFSEAVSARPLRPGTRRPIPPSPLSLRRKRVASRVMPFTPSHLANECAVLAPGGLFLAPPEIVLN